MQTETENGKLMGGAIKAALDMQFDCVKLLRDLDKELEFNDLRAISANTITSGIGSSITSPGLYLASYLYRLYAPADSTHHVLGVTICLHDQAARRYFPEPLFIAANVRYDPTQADDSLATKSWDPWAAFLDWNSDASNGKVLDVTPGRNTIKKIVVVAIPLYSITSIQVAVEALNLVGYPERDPRAVPVG